MILANTVQLYIFFSALLSLVEGRCRNCIKCGDNGECLEGCKPGFIVPICEHPFSCHCLDSLCDHDGAAHMQCNNGYYITFILPAVLFVGTILVAVVCSRCRRRTGGFRFHDGQESFPMRQNDEMCLLTNSESFLLNCKSFRFSRTKYNDTRVHINAEGEMVNTPQPDPLYSDHRLKNYRGTSSTDPLPRGICTQYFEVQTQVYFYETLSPLFLLLEIGLASDDDQDQSNWIGRQPNSYSLSVQHCPIHNSVCRHVRRHGEHVSCLPDTLENTTGVSITLQYGVFYNSARKVIAFLDVANGQIIGKIDMVDVSVALWPMFAVNNAYGANLRMSLVVGKDIDMTDRKKSIIKNLVLM